MILWLNPLSGVSGDMLLGSLLGLGAPLDAVRESIASTGLDGWTLTSQPVVKTGITATQAVVDVTDTATHRAARELLDHAHQARPRPVAALAAHAIENLARAEAALHDQHPDDVHLHEVGGLDTIVDTVGVAAALHSLGIQQVYSAPVALGSGTVECHHGRLPAPAPATLALLRDAHVVGSPISAETVTPTGAALLRAIGTRFDPPPAMSLCATAFGAGTRDFASQPNVLPATLGEPIAPEHTHQQVLLEANVDDVTGELLGHVVTAALENGAADAWTTPTTTKKNRPAHTIHILTPVDHESTLRNLLLSETGTLGLRRSIVDKLEMPRTTEKVQVDGHTIRIKSGPWNAKPEHDDIVNAAKALGRPLRDIATEALTRYRARTIADQG